LENPLDHLFSTYQVNIMQSCDLCGSYIWGMEKAYMCSACKFICHKKCLNKIITDCSTRCARKDDSVPGSQHFGVQVSVLTNIANPVPKVVELLLMHVELNGLYTEGIYRKSGAACRARELHQVLETAQRFRTHIEQRRLTSGQTTDVTQSTCRLSIQDTPSSDDKQQITSKNFNGTFDDLDIPFIDEAEE
ncbi:hypothetical protein GOODEAATRI_000563, partial [Goodea atripinnis]